MTRNDEAARAFNLALDRFIGQQVPATALAVQQKVALDALTGVVRKSPVDTGRFRGNWQLSVAPVSTPLAIEDKQARGSNPGGAVVAAATAAVATAQPYGVIYLTNALPYAQRLENGYSKQAPGGMVALTVAELQAQIAREVKP